MQAQLIALMNLGNKYFMSDPKQSVAQPGSASALGAEGRQFDSARSDQFTIGHDMDFCHDRCRVCYANRVHIIDFNLRCEPLPQGANHSPVAVMGWGKWKR